jgi:DNA-binding transcriptional MocR family regulator
MDRETCPGVRLYRLLAHRLRRDVDSGRYAGRLPPEPTLAREVDVSRGTLRQALALLVREGVLHTIPGRGTFVGPTPAGSHVHQGGAVGLVLPLDRPLTSATTRLGRGGNVASIRVRVLIRHVWP